MTFAAAWIGLPLVLSLLSLGCGLLLEAVSGTRLPGALLLPGGFIVISLAAYFAHMSDTTAPLQTPFVVALSLAGYGVGRPWKRFGFDRWFVGAAVGVYAVFAAPVVLSGWVTFTGYIKLDDTATYMSVLDRALNHAYNLVGLNSSTYEAVLYRGYKFGYPLGSLLPLDVAHTVLRVDPLWLWQPYMTFLAVMIAIGLYQLASGLVESRWLRACVAFFGTQAALIYGYALWGGVKELFAAGVLLFAACLVPRLKDGGPRQVVPLAAAVAAVIGGLSVGGGVWIVPIIIAGLTLVLVYRPLVEALVTILVFTVTSLFLSIPMLSVGFGRLNHLAKFERGGENGNLLHPLSWWQLGGIWPSGDFRTTPTHYLLLTHVLVVVVALAAIFAVVMACQRKRWEVVVALATAVFACLVYVERASPWVAGKSLAVSSPIVLGVGLIGVAVAAERRSRVEAGVALGLLAVIAGGVLWSNAMQYHAVLLGPSARLTELETIGHKFAGQGPALLTEYEPYGARHLLRGLSAESPSELRVRNIYLRNGGYAQPGVSPDIDEIRLDQILQYRTLVIRRTGSASRPPSAYTRVWSGTYYDVWQRSGQSQILRHLSLGSRFQPAAVPGCSTVMSLAHLAAANRGLLATVYRPKVAIVDPLNGQIKAPTRFGPYGEPFGLVHATNAYTLRPTFSVPASGEYGVWVGGSFSSGMKVKVDDQRVGSQWNQTQWPGNFVPFGSVFLAKGLHTLVLKHSGPDWRPGTAAPQPFGLGPVVIAQGTDQRDITYVQPSAARSLCGKTLDWIEALHG
jgi:hypothetical protein